MYYGIDNKIINTYLVNNRLYKIINRVIIILLSVNYLVLQQ